MVRIIHGQVAGIMIGLALGAVLFIGGFLIARSATDAGATHDSTGNVHACVGKLTRNARIMPEGVPPQCNSLLEELVEWPGESVADDLAEVLARVDSLEAASLDQEARIAELESENAEQATRIADLEAALDDLDLELPTCLTTEGDDIVFEGCNVHVRNGLGGTNTTNETGNLIVGYNENAESFARDGSHNLIVGANHGYTQYGGLVAGFQNRVSGNYASVTGGAENTASGLVSSVSGGGGNTASFTGSSVSGGTGNTASGSATSVSGGLNNTASGPNSSVSGGDGNTAEAARSSILGGQDNLTSFDVGNMAGRWASIGGGMGQVTTMDHQFLP